MDKLVKCGWIKRPVLQSDGKGGFICKKAAEFFCDFKVVEHIVGDSGSTCERTKRGVITIPANFRTDGASVPWLVPIITLLFPRDRAEDAGTAHDKLYTQTGHYAYKLTRRQADRVLLLLLREEQFSNKVRDFIARNIGAPLYWLGVRLFGWAFYRKKI